MCTRSSHCHLSALALSNLCHRGLLLNGNGSEACLNQPHAQSLRVICPGSAGLEYNFCHV